MFVLLSHFILLHISKENALNKILQHPLVSHRYFNSIIASLAATIIIIL